MALSAKISGHASFGGLFSYTVYRIDVFFSGNSWCIYRRYNAFKKLHEELVKLFPEDRLTESGIILPENGLGLLSKGVVFSEVVIKRMEEFQRYLRAVLDIEAMTTLDCVTSFFDYKNKGVSGAVIELGASGVICETMALVKPCKRLVEVWNSCFIVLTKQGTIYVLRNIYDSISDPLVAFPVSFGDIHVATPTGSTIVDLSSTNTSARLMIKFSTDAQHANWLRTISDYSTRSATAQRRPSDIPTKGLEPNGSNPQRASSTTTSSYTGETVHLKSKGTGNTADDLSSLYGI